MEKEYFLKKLPDTLGKLEDTELFQVWMEAEKLIQQREVRQQVRENPRTISMVDLYEDGLAIREGRSKGISGMATGYPDLDFLTGGLDTGEFWVIFGPPGRGKTMLAHNIMHNMALRDEPSLFISIETPNAEVSKRTIDMHAFEQQPGEAAHIPLLFYPQDLPTDQETIRWYVDFQVRTNGVKLVVVDHLGMLPELRIGDRRESYNAWALFFARTAKELRVPIILICHVVKLQTDTSEPQLRDLAETSHIENNADMAIAVWQEDEPKEILVKVKKNRNKGRRSGKDPIRYARNAPFYKLTEKSVTKVALQKAAIDLFGGEHE